MNIFEELKSLSEESYKNFIIKLVPTNHNILGVRMPLLKQLAKKIAKESPYEFLTLDKGNNYEMIMLEGVSSKYIWYF